MCLLLVFTVEDGTFCGHISYFIFTFHFYFSNFRTSFEQFSLHHLCRSSWRKGGGVGRGLGEGQGGDQGEDQEGGLGEDQEGGLGEDQGGDQGKEQEGDLGEDQDGCLTHSAMGGFCIHISKCSERRLKLNFFYFFFS